jgi:hypothetical protein
MTAFATFILFAWIPIVLVLFKCLAPHRAVLVALIGGALFLPEIGLTKVADEAPAAVNFLVLIFTKHFVNAFSVLFAAVLCDLKRLQTFRLQWFDLPMVAWCASPFISNIINEPLKESLAAARDQTLIWGVPYFLGRVYFNDLAKFRELAIGLAVGGLIYAPLCLAEIRVFPFFHERLYGFFPGSKDEVIREGSFRPVVFMTHGLAVGMWMVATTLVAVWLWWTGSVTRLPWKRGAPPVPMVWLVIVLVGTTALVRSGGAMTLGVLGLLALWQIRWLKVPVLVAVLLTIAPVYIVGRTSSGATPTGWLTVDLDKEKVFNKMKDRSLQKPFLFGWDGCTGRDVVNWITVNFNEDRAGSYGFRLINEDLVMEKAWQKWLFGWGDRGQSRVKTAKGEIVSVTDGMWIITFADVGFFGLIAVYTAMLLPSARCLWSIKPHLWSHPSFAAPAVAALVLILYMTDCLSNDMFNQAFVLTAGGLAGLPGAGLRLPPTRMAEPVRQELPDACPVPPPAAAPRPGVLARRRPLSK